MSRYGKVGVFGQIKHPRIRGGLDPSHEHRRFHNAARKDSKTDEETYFVPSFSIRRHLHRSEQPQWELQQELMRACLGRGFTMLPPADISLKVIEQHRFIKNMREAGVRPQPNEVRDMAYMIRDGLTNLLTNARSPLAVPLGNFGRFGYKDNALAYEIGEWRGDRAPYAENDAEGYMDTQAVLLAERQLAVGAITLAFGGSALKTDSIAPAPHLTIARATESIADHRIREIRGELGGLALGEVLLGDPVIDLKLHHDMPSEPIYIKHSWESLAVVA